MDVFKHNQFFITVENMSLKVQCQGKVILNCENQLILVIINHLSILLDFDDVNDEPVLRFNMHRLLYKLKFYDVRKDYEELLIDLEK